MSDPYFHFKFEPIDIINNQIINYGTNTMPAVPSNPGLITTVSPLVDTGSLILSSINSQYITLPQYIVDDTGICFCIKIKSNSSLTNSILFDFSTSIKTLPTSTTQYTFQTKINSTGGITFLYIIDGTSTMSYSAVYSTNINNNIEHAIICSISPIGIMNLYIDSLLVSTVSAAYPPIGTIMPFCYIGKSTYTTGYNYFNGMIDDFRVYNYILIEKDITNYYLAKNTNLQIFNDKIVFNDNSILTSYYNYPPIGSIVVWVSDYTTIPDGWYICDGTNGTINLKGRFIVGYNPLDSSYNLIGNTGGEKNVTLSISEMPSHGHFLFDNTVLYAGTDATMQWGENYRHKLDVSSSLTTSSTGGSSSHNNLPPYYSVYFIQRIY